jgi:hypothetical protein
MKKLKLFLSIILISTFAFADERDDLMAEYSRTKSEMKTVCSNISEPIKKIMILGGVSTVSSGVGTLSAGTATVAGVIKAEKDEDIIDWARELEAVKQMNDKQFLAWLGYIGEKADQEERKKHLQDQITKGQKESQTLGTVRTVGDFVAGGTSAVSAATTIGAVVTVDFKQLKADMKTCDEYTDKLATIRTHFMGISLEDSILPEINNIISKCKNFNTDNIDGVKTALTIAGVTSVVGTGTGIAGGIISNKAVQEEKAGKFGALEIEKGGTKEYNTAANILSGVTTATSLSSALLSGIPLINLNKNLKSAQDCEGAF